MKTLKVFLRSFLLASSILTFAFFAFGADGNIDESFNASAVRARGSNLVNLTLETSLKQPDGKILIAGNFQTLGNLARKNIARLNADGSIDETFNPPEITGVLLPYTNQTTTSMIFAIALQADGKILIGGDFSTIDGVSRNKIARLNADGSLDAAFNANAPNQFEAIDSANAVRSLEVAPDGKILLSGVFCYTPATGGNRCRIGRLNPDGTNDDSFQSGANVFEKIKLLPDGRILNFGSGGIQKLTSDGVFDPNFESTFSISIEEAIVLPTNRIVIVGNFSNIQNYSVGGYARLFLNGTLDTSFNNGGSATSGDIKDVHYTSDGKLLLGSRFFNNNGGGRGQVVRLNADGTFDNTFSYPANALNDGEVTEVNEFNNGNILVGGRNNYWDRIHYTNPNGVVLANAAPLIGMSAFVSAVAQQSDGKILVGGRFTVANGVSRNNVVRYNADGTLDTTFVPLTAASQFFVVRKIVPLPDGKILVAMQGERGLVRLNSNGTLDTNFNPNLSLTSDVRDIDLQSDGSFYIVGNINRINLGNFAVVKCQQGGGFEFVIPVANVNGAVNAAAIQPDGKLIVAGDFTQIDGAPRGRIARLNANLTVDATFNPAAGGANAAVNDVAVQSDGKVVAVGNFTSLSGSAAQQYVGRLNADGALDTGFSQAAGFNLNTVKIQDDGKILIGGAMRTVGGLPKSGIARLHSGGAIDNTFQTGAGTNGPVYDIELQPDKKILMVGDFTKYDNVSKLSVVRLQNNSVTPVRAKFDFDGDGRTDISVYRPSNSVWYQLLGVNYQFSAVGFGLAEDIVAPADYDGDGKTDLGIFRPSTGVFWYRSTAQNNAFRAVQFGASGDVPLPSDIDGNGKDDFVLFRPSSNTWLRLSDSGAASSFVFGIAGDKPLVGDFDGDGKADYAIFRPSTGVFWYAASSQNNAFRAVQFGLSTDVPVPADYDGDGKTDFAVFRPSNGGWYILNSSTGAVTITQFGFGTDKPVAADYDGDGKADLAVFRQSTGEWFILRTTAGFLGVQFGANADIAIPGAFIR